jgi:hypothetical protein
MLTQEEIGYSQQKNREHIWKQCNDEFLYLVGRNACDWNDMDQDILSEMYEILCKKANINPF